ncbi:lysophospholipid acyltransferase family protein [Acidiphilium iwatense]|uniref:Lysophospholipid acyltransferase family protein n=1 Tax=Acidiphilium iwatense TaxID=768198 RepID=A0ABS9DTL5_9PROT|nr:lysophospholipid acyltransferase family protein [Acidiphilium iwatense]MCF3946027.1 lysophospholipid acyltransferase family protein [Acidiphilium iwatense]
MTRASADATAAPMIRDTLKAPLKSVWVQQPLGDLAGLYLHGTMATTRWTIDADALLGALKAGTPCIIVFWHECLPSMPILWREAERIGAGPKGYVLASRHRDGRLIARAMRHFGIETISGSTSRGGAAGLRELARLFEAGHPVGLTPDGPRGPRRRAAPGVAQLAALTGAPVFCAAAATSRALTLESWDAMRIPLPFGRGALIASGPILVPRRDWEASLAMIEAGMTANLARASVLCR